MFYCLFILALLHHEAASSSTKLYHFQTNKRSLKDPAHDLTYLVSTSMARALHVRNPQTTSVPLSTNVVGVYTLPLTIGTPPQNFTFVMDTGSNFVWLPCTSHYMCRRCSSLRSAPSTNIPAFIPKQSNSSKILSCTSPKCKWIHPKTQRCDEEVTQCAPYFILYGTGNTGGIPMSETLRLVDLVVPNFVMGCSVVSTNQPAGIAGMGRGFASLPSQLNLTKFAYCSFSFKSINDQLSENSVVLDYSHSGSDQKTEGFIYTPFVPNPTVGNSAYLAYYYIGLRWISVGEQKVMVRYQFLRKDSVSGNGGTVIDSGSTFSFLSRGVFNPLSRELIAQMQARGYNRSVDAEVENGLGPCFDSTSKNLSVPTIGFHFKGGSEMKLPMQNYMATVGQGTSTICLAVITSQGQEEEEGPSIILGNFQLQNYYVEYDLDNERLGLRRQTCN